MDAKSRFVMVFVLVCNTLLLVFVAHMVYKTQADVNGLTMTLATKKDVAAIKAKEVEDVLEKSCGNCHSESRFADFHGTEEEMLAMIEHMQAMAGADIDPRDTQKIHASLALLQCNQCHGDEVLRQMTLKTQAEKMETIREMLIKSKGETLDEEVESLYRSYQQVYGF